VEEALEIILHSTDRLAQHVISTDQL